MLSEVKSIVIVHICYKERFTKCDHNEKKASVSSFLFFGKELQRNQTVNQQTIVSICFYGRH